MNSTRIVVLGMHRSGTSAVIGLLQSAGCYLGEGDDFLPDNEANPKGYWERVDIVNLNKLLLDGCGLDWMSAYRFSPTDVPKATVAEFRKGAKQIISSLDSRGTWVVKDPRMCITLPVWQSLLKDPIYVLCLRHPIEVAMSLKSRNNIPISVGCALWEAYTKAMLVHTAGARRVLVSYTRLLKRPAEESARLVKGLNEAGVDLPPIDESRLSNFVDVRLHRQRLNIGLLGAITPEQLALFNQLEDDNVPDLGALQLQIGMAKDLLELFNANQALSERLKLEAGKFKERISRLVAQRDKREEKIKFFKARLPELKANAELEAREFKEQISRLIAQRDEREEKIKFFKARLPELKANAELEAREFKEQISRLIAQRDKREEKIKFFEARLPELKANAELEAREFKEQISRLIAQRDKREEKIKFFEARLPELKANAELEAREFKEQISRLIAQRDEREEKIKFFEARLPELKALVHSKQREFAHLMTKLREVQKLLTVAGSANDRNKAVGSAKIIIGDIIDSVARDKKHDS